MEIAPWVIGPGRDVVDIYDDWARARETEEAGAVLVRPDGMVGWRSHTLPDDPAGALREALEQILGLAVGYRPSADARVVAAS